MVRRFRPVVTRWWRLRQLRRKPSDHLLWLMLFASVGTEPRPDACADCRALADAGKLRQDTDGRWTT